MKTVVLVFVTLAACNGARVAHPFGKAANSCVGICGDSTGSVGCYCNTECTSFSDCCSDYDTVCFSCSGRCGEAYDVDKPCQCNSGCSSFSDCCTDYNASCGGSTVTDADIIALTEELYTIGSADYVGSLITLNTVPPGPLFTTVQPEALQGATIQAFLTLRTDYDPYTTDADSINVDDKNTFLDAVMATEIMTTTEQFLTDNGFITDPLRDVIDEIFFTLYPRDGSTLGSSGFEHSFMGEIDEGIVKGFHNWISFYEEQLAGNIDYTTYDSELVISSDVTMLTFGFDWYGYTKSTTSMWIGTPPEFELAYYTICFFYKPNALCDVSSNGVTYQIQTYTQAYNGLTLVGSAYPYV